MEERKTLVRVALGEVPADVVIKGGQLVNVHSSEIYQADIAIKGNRIAAVGNVERTIGPETEIIDAQGAYLCPGFIDTHLHVGGSQLSMTELAKVLVSRGTAAISTDFHESGIVGGLKSMKFLADELSKTPLKVLFTPFISAYLGLGPLGNTNRLSGEELLSLLDWPETVGVREWQRHSTDIPDPYVQQFLEEALRRNLVIDGHLANLDEIDLQASIALGIDADHEMASAEEVIARTRVGAYSLIRWGNCTEMRDLEPIIKEIARDNVDTSYLAFCTDDSDAVSLVKDGHMDHCIRLSIQCGLDPMKAVQMATINAAKFMRVDKDLGSIAPGRLAYIVFVSDLEQFIVDKVVANGQLVAEGRRYTAPLSQPEYPDFLYGTVRLKQALRPEDFVVKAPFDTEEVRVRVITETWTTDGERNMNTLPVRNGEVQLKEGIAKIAVIDRHHATGRVGVGFVDGFGIRVGAVATTFNAGIYNLTVMGVDDRDMAMAANRIAEIGGGIVVVKDGKVIAEAPLALDGLYSDKPLDEAMADLEAVENAVRHELGSPLRGFLMDFGFIGLAISSLTGYKITEHGVVEPKGYGKPLEKVSLFVEQLV